MQIHILKSKIHRVKVTDADLNYIGSITIDEDLMDASQMFSYSQPNDMRLEHSPEGFENPSTRHNVLSFSQPVRATLGESPVQDVAFKKGQGEPIARAAQRYF